MVWYHVEYQTILVLKSMRNGGTSLNSYWRFCKYISTAGIKSRPALFWDVMPCILVKRFQKFRSIVLAPCWVYWCKMLFLRNVCNFLPNCTTLLLVQHRKLDRIGSKHLTFQTAAYCELVIADAGSDGRRLWFVKQRQ